MMKLHSNGAASVGDRSETTAYVVAIQRSRERERAKRRSTLWQSNGAFLQKGERLRSLMLAAL